MSVGSERLRVVGDDVQCCFERSHGEGFSVVVLVLAVSWIVVFCECWTYGVVHRVELLLRRSGAVLRVQTEHGRHPPFVNTLHFRRRRVHDVLLRQQQSPFLARLDQVRWPQERERRRHFRTVAEQQPPSLNSPTWIGESCTKKIAAQGPRFE